MAKKTIISNLNSKKERINLSNPKLSYPLPNLIEAQLNSYKNFLEEDLVSYFSTINPIFDNTGKLWSLEFLKPKLMDIDRPENECIRKGLTYQAPLYWQVRLVNKQTGEAKEQEIFMGDVPLMTNRGTFIVNGVERCIVHQIIRAEGVIYLGNGLSFERNSLYMAKIIPSRGAWFTIDTSKTGILSIKLGPRKPKINICTFFRAMGYGSNAEILNLFKDIKLGEDDPNFLEQTLAKDPTENTIAAIFDIYRRLRPDVTASVENAKAYIDSLLFDPKRLYLGDVGRYQLNKKLEKKYHKELSEANNALFISDLVGVVEKLVKMDLGQLDEDDMDHLGNRRVRSVNELLGEVVMDAIKKIEKNTKDKMSSHSTDELLTASDVMSSRPLVTAFRDFFGSSQISRYMTQKNVLSEISNLRHVTAGGPNGLTKERATFSVRDVHYSQYGRFCPVQTPDGQSVGVVNYLALYAKINSYGFIEVPYRKVVHAVAAKDSLNRIPREDVTDGNKVIAKAGKVIDKKTQEALVKAKVSSMNVRPFASEDVGFLDADRENNLKLTYSELDMDEHLNLLDDFVPIRHRGEFYRGPVEEVEYIDVDSGSSTGINFYLIPFANHTEVARNLFEVSNMNQAVPLFHKEAPIVGTGREADIARLSGRSLYAENDGEVEYADAQKVIIKTGKGKKETYNLDNFQASNDNTLIHHTVKVSPGQKLKAGELLADGSSAVDGELAIGTNILCACMFWEGITFEDGWAISERILKNGALNGIIIKTYTRDVRDTKLGPEVLTADIPGVSEALLGNLDSDGIIRRGAKVKSGDIIAGIISPRGDLEVTAEEKLLRAIFGESAHDVKDVSLRMPNGESGIVIDTQILDRTEEELSTGVIKQVKIWVAKEHHINIGDKLCDMAGQKGVISKIVPEEDMPYLPDGTPVDLIFTPLFLKRMNVSILREMSLGMRAHMAGVNVAIPAFTTPDEKVIDDMLSKKKLEHKDKYELIDGRTGDKLDQAVAVGMKYILKIEHLAEDKIHARSTGPYTIVTQQPLGGKAQFGGQRFGEMEVWALEAHGAAHVLQEMLTIKSDDIDGRSKAYEAIIHGKPIRMEGTPESFKVFISELRALGLDIRLDYGVNEQ
ncbi:MAG: DNA-directed RNA polymerase subunit beta [Candidatus Dojkabacteria bacterium]